MAGYANLGQSLANATPTNYNTLYAPTSQSVASTLSICNLTSSSQTFSVRIRVGGASANDKQFIIKDSKLLANDTIFLTIGLSMGAGEILEVAASTPNVAFNLSGLST
jgi:hypothetical protein